MSQVNSKRVGVVVGGAGLQSGLGAGIVQRLVERDMRVAILDVDAAAAERSAEALRAQGHDVISIGADVTDESTLASAATRVEAEFGACHLLFANVGGGRFNRIEDYPLDAWRREIEVMVLGTVATVDAFLPLMKRTTGYRRLVLTSSIAAIAPGRFQAPYRAAKAAVMSIGETLDLELGPEGIGATVAFPSGMIQDEQIETAWEYLSQIPEVPSDVRPPAGSPELGTAVGSEMSRDRADMATGYDAAGRILAAVDDGRRFVVTHGITVEGPARERLALIEAALRENADFRDAAKVS